jgi:hypothetical protein
MFKRKAKLVKRMQTKEIDNMVEKSTNNILNETDKNISDGIHQAVELMKEGRKGSKRNLIGDLVTKMAFRIGHDIVHELDEVLEKVVENPDVLKDLDLNLNFSIFKKKEKKI